MAIGVAVVGAMVIVWAGIAFEEKLVEQWYLWKLDSAEEEEQKLAAEMLGQMKSRRAIPRVVEILRRLPQRGAARSVVFSPGLRRAEPTITIRDAAAGKEVSRDARSHYTLATLIKIGRPAVPALLRLIEDTDVWNRLAAAAALNEIDPQEFQEVAAAPLREILKQLYE